MSTTAPLRVRVTEEGDVCVVHVAGELDLASAPALQARLDEVVRTSRRVVVDLAELAFVDVVGLRALLHAQAALSARSGGLVLRACPPSARRVVAGLGLQQRPPEAGGA